MTDYQRLVITVEMADTGPSQLAATQVLAKLVTWLQEELVHTGRLSMELLPPSRY